ncbi:hypothetical protein FB451DRAFT_1190168 [Mycena latifolia]|nr:hypothetical protein FB451DRAFT_1190168 [Mycena latifolia]
MSRPERILVVQEMRGVTVEDPQDFGWRDSENIAVSGARGVGGRETKVHHGDRARERGACGARYREAPAHQLQGETQRYFNGVEKSCSASAVDVFAKSSPPIRVIFRPSSAADPSASRDADDGRDGDDDDERKRRAYGAERVIRLTLTDPTSAWL